MNKKTETRGVWPIKVNGAEVQVSVKKGERVWTTTYGDQLKSKVNNVKSGGLKVKSRKNKDK